MSEQLTDLESQTFMDHSKLELLRQVRIEEPCDADWDDMTGDERSRHCAQCNLSVNNVAEMSAIEAEELFAKGGHVCARLTVDDQQSVLTRDGWIPRMALAGAIAATMTGCGHAKSTAAVSTTPSNVEIIKDKFVEIGTEAYYKAVPRARPKMMIAGAIMAPSLYISSGKSSGGTGTP